MRPHSRTSALAEHPRKGRQGNSQPKRKRIPSLAESGNDKTAGAIPSERALFAGRFGHGRLGFDGDLSIIIEDFKRARYRLSLSFKRMQAYILA